MSQKLDLDLKQMVAMLTSLVSRIISKYSISFYASDPFLLFSHSLQVCMGFFLFVHILLVFTQYLNVYTVLGSCTFVNSSWINNNLSSCIMMAQVEFCLCDATLLTTTWHFLWKIDTHAGSTWAHCYGTGENGETIGPCWKLFLVK